MSDRGTRRAALAEGSRDGQRVNAPSELVLDYTAILQALDGQHPEPAATVADEPEIDGMTGASIDSRTLRPGQLFVALPGTHSHGARFLSAAFAAGAALALVARRDQELVPPEADRTRIVWVDDAGVSLTALGRAARRRHAKLTMVCVTGSYGKTTSKEMVAAALASSLHVHRTPGNYNNQLGVPITLCGLTRRHQAAVVELGMNAPGEIALLAALAAPQVGVLTGVGRAHLAGLKSRAAIIAAKLELAGALGRSGQLILPADDQELLAAARRTGTRLLTVSAGWRAGSEPGRGSPGAPPDLIAEEVRVTPAGVRFRIRGLDLDGLEVELATPVRVLVLSALLALAVGQSLGLGGAAMAAALGRAELPARRLSLLRAGDVVILDDSYNANPESMAAALATLAELDLGRRVAVLGDMRELGTASHQAHVELGTRAAESLDRLFVIGEESATVARAARAAGLPDAAVIEPASRDELIRDLLRELEPGDGLLVKASRSLGLEAVVEAVLAARPTPAADDPPESSSRDSSNHNREEEA
jgi:UDP-N-acetylmuramoyl-tripeptide--D-alanyl-D-alanine ligase